MTYLLPLLLLSLVLCSAEVRVSKEHTTTLPVPHGWEQTRKADPEHITRITIAITQQNTDELERIFWEVSDPRNPNYGRFLTLEQVNDLVAPSKESTEAIEGWLISHDILDFDYTYSGDFLNAYATVSQIEELLETSYYVYRHSSTGQELVRALAPYTVPASIAPHVDFVGGLTHFPKRTSPKMSKKSPSVTVTPAVIKKFFNIDPTLVGTARNNSQAVAQFLGQYYSPSDLSTFQSTFDLPAQTVAEVVGPNNPNNPGLEASLDIEYIMALAVNVPTWFVYTSGLHDGQEPFLDWITNMSSNPNAPFVHSVSYGDVESSISLDYAIRINQEFQKYGTVGRSILFASGDDGTGCHDLCHEFVPNWPASSPYVTSVGGIELNSDGSATGDQISSGGFSNYFGLPSYQADAVSEYLNNHTRTPSPSAYNASGRAFPDICSFSEGVQIVVSGYVTTVGGTSCAAPVVSGVITLINDARLNAGKSPLGFLNPFIYQTQANHSDAFIDITQGENNHGCCLHGFEASVGWDPITGVGAPNFPNLLQYGLAV